jgi:hypothetical protein
LTQVAIAIEAESPEQRKVVLRGEDLKRKARAQRLQERGGHCQKKLTIIELGVLDQKCGIFKIRAGFIRVLRSRQKVSPTQKQVFKIIENNIF